MMTEDQHQREKKFIETYIYGKDEHGKHIAGGYSIQKFVDSTRTSQIGLQRLQDLSVPLGLVYVPTVKPPSDSTKIMGGALSTNPVKIIENDIVDRFLHLISQPTVTHSGKKRTSRKTRNK
jgi:hypothetical protein